MNTGNKAKIRLYLFLGSILAIVIVAAFLIILNINEPIEYTEIPFQVLLILTVMSCAAMAVFFSKGPVFSIDGKIERANINAMLLTVLVIIQISFFFEILSIRNQSLNYQKYTNIRKNISIAENCNTEDLNKTLSELCKNEVAEISIVDENGVVLYSSDEAKIGNTSSVSKYSYSFGKSTEIRFFIDPDYVLNTIRAIALNLLTVLVTSIFFSGEIVLLMIRLILRKTEEENAPTAENYQPMPASLYYIRQIAFIFYFVLRLSSAFIPVMTKSLYNPFSWLSDTTAAGLPQSSETLLTCAAIFLATLTLEKKGWKIPFIFGLFMVGAGTFLSAFSWNIIIFILSRAVVGLGYGFCWMTLRNLSLLGRDDKERLLGFALLNTGIYAGINCGSSLGAILADIFGYRVVFAISAVLTIFISTFIIRMENAMLPSKKTPEKSPVNEGATVKQKGFFVENMTAILFVLLMIAPASIAESYLSYYLPLYFTNTGRSITDVGRARLLYGMVIVYAGPFISGVLSVFSKKALQNINFAYNFMIALSLFLPSIGAGLLLPFAGAAILGTANSFGFGAQNNYFLALPSIKSMGAARSLSVLSFIKKMLEMTGPLIFAFVISAGFQSGIRYLSTTFAIMAVIYIIFCSLTHSSKQ
ncbi:MAG: MFS transporter [Synergistaceae bacterium]|nr:MFS transporter [Synergistaceae bacterium]